MKTNRALASLITAVFVAFAAGCATEPSQEQLRAQAKLSQAQAQEIALGKAPNGTVKSAELEKEKGRLVWSFDITTPGTENVTEVLVDAVTGSVVSMEIETPAKEAGEARRKAKWHTVRGRLVGAPVLSHLASWEPPESPNVGRHEVSFPNSFYVKSYFAVCCVPAAFLFCDGPATSRRRGGRGRDPVSPCQHQSA